MVRGFYAREVGGFVTRDQVILSRFPNPIRLATLATFPAWGRLCPSLFFFHICVYLL